MGSPRFVYLPGLGADEALFEPQIERFGGEVPEWIAPDRGDDLGSYAVRQALSFDTLTPWVAIGFSFGGMVALEIARRVVPARRPVGVILISGLRSRAAVSAGFKIQRAVGGLVPRWVVRVMLNGPAAWAFAKRDGLDDQRTGDLVAMARRTDVPFLMWGSEACCRWDFDGECPVPVRQVHGRRDRIIPYVPHGSLEGGEAELVDGGHLVTWTAAEAVNGFIETSVRSMMSGR